MSILSFIKKICVQRVVYWGNPQPNGSGGFTFSTPVTFESTDEFGGCRWEDAARVQTTSKNGKEFHNKAVVTVAQKLDLEGWLHLGSLDDFESGVDTDNPIGLPDTYQIIAIDTSPLFRSQDKFVYTIYLGFGNVQN